MCLFLLHINFVQKEFIHAMEVVVDQCHVVLDRF